MSGACRCPSSSSGPAGPCCSTENSSCSLDLPIPAGSAGGVWKAHPQARRRSRHHQPVRAARGRAAGLLGVRRRCPNADPGCRRDRGARRHAGWTDAADEALASMLTSTRPISDVRGGRDYRAAMLPVLSKRAWQTARERLASVGRSNEARRMSDSPIPSASQRAGPRGLAPAHKTLLDVLRDELRLTGTKECCAEGECGACTVHVDGDAVCAAWCSPPRCPDMRSRRSRARLGGRLDPLQAAFVECGAVQCGFCIPGMIMSARALLNGNPRPTREEAVTPAGKSPSRCGGYSRIVDAVLVPERRRDPSTVLGVASSGVER